MASKAAYYEGLQYANKDVKPVDFGALAMGLADVEQKKFDRAEKERKEDEAFQLKINEDFGDIVYPAFDKSGLENADIYMDGASQMISARAQDLNDQYNSGDISRIQYRREMTKLKGQTQQLTNNIGMIEKFVEEYRAQGDNIDPASQDTMEELQALFEDSKPYLTKDNRLGNLSSVRNENGELEPRGFLWDKAASMLQVQSRYDTFDIAKQVLNIQGDLSKFVGSDAVIKTHLDKKGNLKEGTINLIKESISTLSDRQIISYARQNGYDVEKDKTDTSRLLNRESLEAEILKDQQEKTTALLSQKSSLDEFEKQKLDISLQDSYLKQKRMSEEERAKKKYSYAYYTKESAEVSGIGLSGDVEEYSVTKDIPIKNIPIQELKLVGNLGADAIESGQLKQLHRNGNGEYMVTIGYTEKQPDPTQASGFRLIPQTRKIPLTSRPQKNYFLTLMELPTISDPIDTNKVDENNPLGI